MTLLFVYGSLKRNFGNNKVLKNIKDDIIRLRAFENDEHPAIDATIKLLKHQPPRGRNLAKK
mgnify:CR=1 FL=1